MTKQPAAPLSGHSESDRSELPAMPGGELRAQLMKFYGVTTLEALVDKQAYHVERLQAKLPQTPNVFATQRVREG